MTSPLEFGAEKASLDNDPSITDGHVISDDLRGPSASTLQEATINTNFDCIGLLLLSQTRCTPLVASYTAARISSISPIAPASLRRGNRSPERHDGWSFTGT
jgi:hypothetical protein